MDDSVTVTIWRDVFTPDGGKQHNVDWPKIRERVVSPKPPRSATKEKNTVWHFGTFRDGRHDAEHLDVVYALHLDFDSDPSLRIGDPKRGNPTLTVEDILRALPGVRLLAYTSWQHAPGAARRKVIVLLDAPVTGDEYRRLCRVVEERFKNAGVGGLDADETWKEPSRWHFAPMLLDNYQGYATDDDVPPAPVAVWLAEADALDCEAEAATWPPLLPGPGAACPVPFPVDALPPELAACVVAVADAIQVPPDLPACVMLALAAGAASGHAVVEVRDGWIEQLVLWTCVVMRPGARKSPIFTILRKALDRRADYLRAEWAREVAAIEGKRARLKAEMKAAKKDIDGCAKIEAELAALTVPPSPVLAVSDATPEVIARLLVENGERLTLASDEGVMFQHMAGLYRDGAANLDVFLQGWCGGRVSVHRIGRPSIEIGRALLSVAVTIQPSMLGTARAEPEMAGRGVLARFLWCVPPDSVGFRDVDAVALDRSALEGWDRVYSRVLAAPTPGNARELRLDWRAGRDFREWCRKQEVDRRPGGPLDASDTLRDWAAKADGTAVRIAGLFHILDGAPTDLISGEHMTGAIRIMDYFAEHTRHALVTAGVDPVERLARRIMDWLKRDPARVVFTVRCPVPSNSPTPIPLQTTGRNGGMAGEPVSRLGAATARRTPFWRFPSKRNVILLAIVVSAKNLVRRRVSAQTLPQIRRHLLAMDAPNRIYGSLEHADDGERLLAVPLPRNKESKPSASHGLTAVS